MCPSSSTSGQADRLQWSPGVCGSVPAATSALEKEQGLSAAVPFRSALAGVCRLGWEGYWNTMSMYSFRWVAHCPSHEVAHLPSSTVWSFWSKELTMPEGSAASGANVIWSLWSFANQLLVKSPLCVAMTGRGAVPSLKMLCSVDLTVIKKQNPKPLPPLPVNLHLGLFRLLEFCRKTFHRS